MNSKAAVFYMGFTIKVPELSRRNLTPKVFFQFLAILLFHEICHLQELYPSEAIDDIKAPPCFIGLAQFKDVSPYPGRTVGGG